MRLVRIGWIRWTDSAIRIAAVGDMNGVRTSDPSSESGRNGAAIAAALKAGTVDAFLGLGDFQYDIAYCADYVNYWKRAVGRHQVQAVLDQRPEPRLGARAQRGPRQLHERPVSRGHDQVCDQRAAWVHRQRRPVLLRPRQLALRDAQLGAVAIRPGPGAQRPPRWLDRDLAAAKAAGKHLAVAYHEPYFTSDTAEPPARGGSQALGRRHRQVRRPAHLVRDPSTTTSGPARSWPTTPAPPATGTGTTAFQVSTGGIGLRAFTSSPAYIVKRFSDTHGWLKLTLKDDGGFTWEFMPVAGPGTDSGRRPPAR